MTNNSNKYLLFNTQLYIVNSIGAPPQYVVNLTNLTKTIYCL